MEPENKEVFCTNCNQVYVTAIDNYKSNCPNCDSHKSICMLIEFRTDDIIKFKELSKFYDPDTSDFVFKVNGTDYRKSLSEVLNFLGISGNAR